MGAHLEAGRDVVATAGPLSHAAGSSGVRVLVTGAAGFIGGHLVRALAARGFETFGLDRREVHGLPLTGFYATDLRDSEGVQEALAACAPSVVFHLAAQSSVIVSQREPSDTIEDNVTATTRLADLAASAGVRRFVFFSTGGAMYGDPPGPAVTESDPATPQSVYGASKLAAETLLLPLARLRGIELSVLRPGNVYGPGQDAAGESGVVAIFAERMLRGDRATIFGDGGQIRDYVYVDDVVDAAIRAAQHPPALCHVSSGTPRSTLEVFEAVAAACEYRLPPVFEPARVGEIQGATLDPAEAYRRWGWRAATDFETGIARTVESFRERRHASSVLG